MIYVESITNPLVQVADLEAVVAFARAHELISVIDNTFASPVNFRPAEIGFDLSLHSGTKYLNGHSDIVCGAVIGQADVVARVKKMMNYLGGSLDAHACFLLHRGLKTLAVRVRQQNESALALARVLEANPAVTASTTPVSLQLRTRAGGEAVRRIRRHAEFRARGRSGSGEAIQRSRHHSDRRAQPGRCGDADHPAGAHLARRPDRRRNEPRSAWRTGLIRVSVGIEGTEDLIRDFEAALATL